MKKLLASLCLATALCSPAAAQTNTPQTTGNPLVHYQGFMELSEEVMAYREDRLLGADQWFDLSRRDEVIILDTRSKAAFDMAHLAGAVHLNFSDFTDEKLAKVIGDKDKTILIYCNNNFDADMAPVMLKRIELALNIPTFINLYGYGYKNVFELNEVLSLGDPRVELNYAPEFKEMWEARRLNGDL